MQDNQFKMPEEPLLEGPNEPLLETAHEDLLEANNVEATNNRPTPTIAIEPAPVENKKSKKLLMIAISVFIVIFAAAIICMILLVPSKKSTSTITHKDTAPTNQTVTKTPIESTTDILTTGSDDESKITNTDDSSIANDITSASTSVGESINENNF